MINVLITGIGSGIGKALAKRYLDNGDNVYAIGQNFPKDFDSHTNFFFFPYDLRKTYLLQSTIEPFIKNRSFHTVILNAGMLGDIEELCKLELSNIKDVMELNVWANKELIDTISKNAKVQQIVAMSSGAALNGSKGWGPYSLSKSALNMLIKVYAKELPEIHFTALAPGIVKTPMTEQIIKYEDANRFPAVEKIKKSKMKTADDAAKDLIYLIPKLYEYESGSFIDIRDIELN